LAANNKTKQFQQNNHLKTSDQPNKNKKLIGKIPNKKAANREKFAREPNNLHNTTYKAELAAKLTHMLFQKKSKEDKNCIKRNWRPTTYCLDSRTFNNLKNC